MLSSSYCFARWGRGAVLVHCRVSGTRGGTLGQWDMGVLLERSAPLSVCKVMGHRSLQWRQICWLPSHGCVYWYQRFDPRSHLLTFSGPGAPWPPEQRGVAQYLPTSPAAIIPKKMVTLLWESLSLWIFLQVIQKRDVTVFEIMVPKALCAFGLVHVPEWRMHENQKLLYF